MADEPDPTEFMTPLEQMAVIINETYLAFLKAGFNQNQALKLTMKSMEIGTMEADIAFYSDEDLDEDD
jgi:hypothetical protein